MKNLFLVLQRKARWLYLDSGNLLDQLLFDAFITDSGFKSKENFKKKYSKAGQTQRLNHFNISIKRWLDHKYPSHKHFYHTDSIIYERDRKLQRLTESAGGVEIKISMESYGSCEENYEELMECGDECGRPDCFNKEASSGTFKWESLMRLSYEGKEVGAGIRSITSLQAQTFLGNVTGEAITHSELAKRKKMPERWTYIFLVSKSPKLSLVAGIDPFFYGNHARFFNHSCQPNCTFELWLVKGKWTVKFYTTKIVQEVSKLNFPYCL